MIILVVSDFFYCNDTTAHHYSRVCTIVLVLCDVVLYYRTSVIIISAKIILYYLLFRRRRGRERFCSVAPLCRRVFFYFLRARIVYCTVPIERGEEIVKPIATAAVERKEITRSRAELARGGVEDERQTRTRTKTSLLVRKVRRVVPIIHINNIDRQRGPRPLRLGSVVGGVADGPPPPQTWRAYTRELWPHSRVTSQHGSRPFRRRLGFGWWRRKRVVYYMRAYIFFSPRLFRRRS